MKNSLNYLNLWQQKRDELPVTDSVQTDWLQMQNMLNMHMPVVSLHTPPKSAKVLKASKILKTIKAFKTLILLVSTSATFVAGLYIFHHSHKIKPNQPGNRHKKQLPAIIADSLKLIDSLNRVDSIDHKPDSVPIVKSSPGNSTNPATNKQDSVLSDKSLADGKKANIGKNKNGQNISKASQNTRLSLLNNGQYANKGLNIANHYSRMNQVGTNGGNPFSSNSKNGYNGAGALSFQNGGRQNSNYQPLVLAASTQTSQYLIPNIDSVQADINNYFTRAAVNTLTPVFNSNQKNYLQRQNSAAVNAIVNKIGKPKPVSTKQASPKTNQKDKSGKKEKFAKVRSAASFNLDWGLLTGVNTLGSFTSKKQNSNFYGSFPVDLNFGLYGTYHFNDKWGLNLQVKALNPQSISGSYSHANSAKADSGAVDSGKTIKVTDSRKAYFVSVPIHLVYKVNNYLSIKGGPVINIPVKQLAGTTSLTPLAIKKDTPYYTSVTSQLKNTRYSPAINVSLSVGVSLQYNRFSFEATYLKSISGYKVTSNFGSYKSNPGSIQLGIGFQLNKPKNR